MTGSIAKDGQTSMTGQFKGFAGSVSAPGITFSTDLDSGLYRIGANNIGLALNGAKVADFATTGVAVTGTLSSTGAFTVTSGGATITAGGLTVTAGGLTVTAGAVSLPAGALATAALADDAITYAKIQNVSATNKLLGRATSGAGDVEEIGLAATLQIIGGNLGVTSNPASVYISTTTVSGASALNITSGIDSTYDEYELHVADLQAATDGAVLRLQVSTDGGSNYQTANYLSGIFIVNSAAGSGADSSTSGILLVSTSGSNTADNSTSYSWRGLIRFWPNGSSARKNFNVDGSHLSNGNGFTRVTGGGVYDNSNTAINAVRIIASSGNISGTVRLVGIKNS